MKVALGFVIIVTHLRGAWSAQGKKFSLLSWNSSGFLYTDHVVFESQVHSKVECASHCYRSPSCVCFTVTSNMTCRGHSSASPSVPSLGAVTYFLDWFGMDCASGSDCTEGARGNNTVCYEGQCQCIPGYFYSVFANTCLCGGHLVAKAVPQMIYSHAKYGDMNYDDNADCVWRIQAQEGFRIQLRFTAFELEVQYDAVTVYDGLNETDKELGHFWGSDTPEPINSTGPYLMLHFRTDGSVTRKGFSASYVLNEAPPEF